MAITPSSADDLKRWQHLRAETIAALESGDVLAELQTQLQGLATQEATIRLQAIGAGTLTLRPGWRRIAQFLTIFIRPILLPLWIGAFIAFAIDRAQTAQALIVAATLNTIVAALQERKAERATAALHDALPAFARVLRNGQEQHVLTTMLAPGDILLLRPNDIVPADARLIQADHMHTSNAILRPDDSIAHKTVDPFLDDPRVTVELPNIVYAGGRIVSGQGRAVVFATGLRTAFGQIAALTQRAHEEPSPLLLAVARLGMVVLTIGTIGAVLGYIYAVNGLRLSVQQGLGIAVLFLTAAVPTGLMPGITLALVEGARRLQARQAIFRRLSNVETLGATTVICADKTGTLTQNEMTVREIWTADGTLNVSGVGYQPRGEFSSERNALDPSLVQKQAKPLLRAAVLTSTARLLPPDTLRPQWHIVGDPVEAAFLSVAAKAKIKPSEVYESAPQLAVLNSNRTMALDGVIVDEANQPVVYVKGMPMAVLSCCTTILTSNGARPLTDRDRQAIKRTLQRNQSDAMRTIAFAYRRVPRAEVHDLSIEQAARDLTLLGMLAVVDPPRQEVAEAIKTCHDSKIRTIMMTSDDTIGATSLARRCDIVHGAHQRVITGPELETMDDATLKEQLRTGDMVLARLTPEHKVRVVEALESLGEVVLVTGGAASDVPALKAAYTGIAMGATGSPAARQAADVILLDDNFATVAEAIAEGRAVEQRVRRLVALNLATTVVKIVALVVSLAAGLPLLLTVGQQLLIDFLAGLLPGLAIGAGRPDPRLMQRPPRLTGRPLLSRKVYILGYGVFGVLATALALMIALVFLSQGRAQDGSFDLADLFINNLQPYQQRIVTAAGQRGLVATTLYVVVSIATLLGITLIRRSAAAHDRRPILLLLSFVGLSFAILFGIVTFDVFHPYVALAMIPLWGWGAALAATLIGAGVERLRQRLDPIFIKQPVPDTPTRLRKVQSAK